MSVFTGIFYFLILTGILVFIHEGGHFIFAKLFKVRVFVFSLGMGPRLFGFKKGDTDYRISAVPIGGYVRMLGEDPAEELSEEELAHSMHGISAPKKAVIYAAGPAMNLIFPFFLYFFIFLGQHKVPPAEIGMIVPDTPAQKAGLLPGDIITAIDGNPVYSFNYMVDIISGKPGETIKLDIDRNGHNLKKVIVPAVIKGSKYQIPLLSHITDEKGQIGIIGIYANSIIGVDYDSIAYKAGLKTFDKIVSVNGVNSERLIDIEREFLKNRGNKVTLSVRSLKEKLPKTLFPDAKQSHSISLKNQPGLFLKPHTVYLTVPKGFKRAEDAGIRSNMGYVVHVNKGGAGEKAGLQKGDRLVSVDHKEATSFGILSTISKSSKGKRDTESHTLSWIRDGRIMSSKYKAGYISAGSKRDLGVEDDRIDPGFYLQPYSLKWLGVVPKEVSNPAPVFYSIHMSIRQTLFWADVIIDVLKSVVTGNISPKSFSGPIGIGHAAAQVGQEGPSAFLGFMGFISLNLGLMNLLLPIPILDGGRLVLVGTEVIMRRKLSKEIQEKIMLAGAIMILMLMVWAVVMDIARLFVS